MMAFDEESALSAIEAMGYPCVLKPVVGSWGRLLAKVDNRHMAESLIEHKAIAGSQSSGFLYSGIYQQTWARHPRFCDRRRNDLRHLSFIRKLDHQHCARRRGNKLSRH